MRHQGERGGDADGADGTGPVTEPATANSLAFQQDGTIALAVSARIAGSGRALLLRITPDGRLADHPATVVGDITSTASNVAVAPDNRIVLIGSGYAPRAAANEQSRADFMVARFLPDGTPDRGFAREGWTLTDVGELKDHDEPYAIAVQPDGKIVVTGSSNVRYWLIMRAYSFATVRYDRDGSLDKSFGDRGRAITRMGVSREDRANTILIQPDGKIVVGGSADSNRADRNSAADFALARYLPDGRLDASFGDSGRAGSTGLGVLSNILSTTALDTSGRIVVGGKTTVSNDRPRSQSSAFAPLLARYAGNGSLDRSFGKSGFVMLDPGPLVLAAERSDDEKISSVAIDSQGRIVAVGNVRHKECGLCAAVLRFNPDGGLDPSFAAAGFFLMPFAHGYRVVIQRDGKLLVMGAELYRPGQKAGIVLLRLTPDGTPDPTFGPAPP